MCSFRCFPYFYLLQAYGFLASKEVTDDQEGNMGLLDRLKLLFICIDGLITLPTERLALAWVQKYIGKFGGDKSKVLL